MGDEAQRMHRMGLTFSFAAVLMMAAGIAVGRITAPEPDETDRETTMTILIPRTCDTAALAVRFGNPNLIEVECRQDDGSVTYAETYEIGGLSLNQEPSDPSRHTEIKFTLERMPIEHPVILEY